MNYILNNDNKFAQFVVKPLKYSRKTLVNSANRFLNGKRKVLTS